VRSAAPFAGAIVLICALAACCGVEKHEGDLPALAAGLPVTSVGNRPLLYERLIAAYGQDYLVRMAANHGRKLNDGMTVYYLQRELQSLVDMWRGTGNPAYLDFAKSLTFQAIHEATDNPMPLLRRGQMRGDWPCFYLDKVAAETGGHNQLCDFQGSTGFLLVARALHELNDPLWSQIADFVEQSVVEKWLYYNPAVTPTLLTEPDAFRTVLTTLNSGRDVREHLAGICLDLDGLGYDSYAYRSWGERLVELYLTPRYDSDEPAPNSEGFEDVVPSDWGLFVQVAEEGHVWFVIPDYGANTPDMPLDTSHANRTAWLACRAYAEGLIDEMVLGGLINTLKLRIWAPGKGPLYFNNYCDGSDGMLGPLASGRGGNVWFGWHRLAAYDQDLEDLFLALAYDLTNGGPNLPDGAQNKMMQNAPLCLEAWGTRLLGSKGELHRFP
jgi:hypothetical protein